MNGETYIVLKADRRNRDFFEPPRKLGPLTNDRLGVNVDIEENVDRAEATELAADPDVEAVAPVLPLRLHRPSPATRPKTVNGTTWGIRAVGADSCHRTGAGVTVAVLDTGIEVDHKAFHDVQISTCNFTDGADGDTDGHGTHCAATIFGRTVDGVRIGVAPGVTQALIGKVLDGGGGSTLQLLNAMQWAVDAGAHVISMSLGYDIPGYIHRLIREGLDERVAISMAMEDYFRSVTVFERLTASVRSRAHLHQETVIVAAAGNESSRKAQSPVLITAAPPSASDGVVAVGAVRMADPTSADRGGADYDVANFSNTGADLVGPGVDVTSASLDGGLVTWSGTSMATPHVAGVAALWAEELLATGGFSRRMLEGKLWGTASREGLEQQRPVDVGAGIVKAPVAS